MSTENPETKDTEKVEKENNEDKLSAYSDDSYQEDITERPEPRILRQIEPDQKQVPILKGMYEENNGNCIWMGIWGMGFDGTILGNTSEFRYSIKRATTETATFPQSGIYSGYFFFKSDVPRRIYEKEVQLDFTAFDDCFQVIGKGSNEFGEFTLIGVFDPTSKDLTCTKEYQPKPAAVKKKVKKAEKPKTPKPVEKPKSEPPKKERHGVSAVDELQKCAVILQHLMDHPSSPAFLHPVDPVKLNIPDYLDIIKNPMDFSTIRTRLSNGEIKDVAEFERLVRLVFDNAILYNKPSDPVSVMAATLSDFFEKEMSQIFQCDRIVDETPRPRRRKQFVNMGCETFCMMQRVQRNGVSGLQEPFSSANVASAQSNVVQTFLKAKQEQCKRRYESLLAKEKEINAMFVKEEPATVDYKTIELLKKELLKLKPEVAIRILGTVMMIPAQNANSVTLNLNELNDSKIQSLWMSIQQEKEKMFLNQLEMEEVKRRKAITEKFIKEEKNPIAKLLDDSDDS